MFIILAVYYAVLTIILFHRKNYLPTFLAFSIIDFCTAV